MNIGIIIDSSAGISKKEAEARKWKFLPLHVSIEGKDYEDGIDLDNQKFYKTIDIDADVKTSATPPGVIINVIKQASKEFDHVIIYPLSQGLSSQCDNIENFSQEYKNIHVIQSKAVGYIIVKQLEAAEKLLQDGKSVTEVVKHLNQVSSSIFGLALPENMKWLVKGGRVSAAAAALGNLLSIVPIISLKDGKLDKHGKGRVFAKSAKKSFEFIKENFSDYKFMIYKGKLSKNEDEIIANAKKILNKIEIKNFPPVIVTHTGPGVIGIIAYKI